MALLGRRVTGPPGRALGVLMLVATLGLASAGEVPTVLMGIVVAVEQENGSLTLEHGDGTRSHLTAGPHLLQGIRIGDPVQAVVEGTRVRTLGPL